MARITYKVHDIVIPEANDPTKTISKTPYLAEDHHAETGMIGFPGTDRTIATGKVIPLDTLSTLRGEGASADALDFIEYGAGPEINDKDLVWVQQGAEAITLNHNTSTPPANSGPLLLLSKANKKMIGVRMVLFQRQGNNFQEIAFDGTVGDGGVIVEDDSGLAIIVAGSVASAVNHLKVSNAATGTDVILEAIGTDANIGITLTPKGTGKIKALNSIITTIFDTAGLAWLKVEEIASAVNEITIKNNITANDPEIKATGDDTDIGIVLTPKGTGIITAINTKITNIREATGGALALIITGAASIVNHFEMKPSVTTADLELNALGTDTNIGIKIQPKGTGIITALNQTITNIREATGNALAIVITAIASAVNYIEVKANVTTADPEIQAKGSDTDVGIKLAPQGKGLIRGNIETMELPLGDESTPVASTGIKYTFYMRRAGKFVGAGFASATIAPTTAALILDIHLNGTTIFSTLPEVAAAALEGSNGVLTSDPTTFAAGDKIELLVDTIDTGATGAGAKVGVSFYYT